MKRSKKQPGAPAEAGAGTPFNNPFGALARDREALPAGPPPRVEKAPTPAGPARAVVRMERKGRGGKEVTVIEQLELPVRQLEVWLKALKGALGCGGVVEEGALVLQGDHRERIKAWLEARGVKRVSVG
jgi:translation initiation factor 1